MNFRSNTSHRNRDVEITVIPLIDLFMVVLVFFILTTTFNQETVFFVDLPETKDAQGVSEEVKQIQVSISADGELALNNQKINLEGLHSYLKGLGGEGKKNIPVLIRADQSVPHGKVVDVIDVVQAQGFNNMGILTRDKN
ncbi:MAG: biopolymer transporter ExbD [Proteobacteria bacterium]|jgi:biopolymer transport protein ExbD|nr:biopolymer transporter ExbD [Pseudomonadota bacterium]